MLIRQYFKQENGRRTAYWALVESHRTATGPRQRVVAWLGKLDEAGRLGVKQAAEVGRRYIVGTPKSMLKKFEQEILKEDWHSIRDGLEVKIVPWPKSDDDVSADNSDSAPERFILCRSRDRSRKEEGITQRFEKKIEVALTRMKARCEKQKRDPMKVEREIGKMLGHNTRAEKLFKVDVTKTEEDAARIEWSKVEATRSGFEIRSRCISKPTDRQQILLEKLRLKLPAKIIQKKM